MAGWMDGWMCGWVGACMDGWMDELLLQLMRMRPFYMCTSMALSF